MGRIEEISRAAWPGDPATHLPLNEATTRRVLAGAMKTAEASGELPSEFLRRACEQARTRKDTP